MERRSARRLFFDFVICELLVCLDSCIWQLRLLLSLGCFLNTESLLKSVMENPVLLAERFDIVGEGGRLWMILVLIDVLYQVLHVDFTKVNGLLVLAEVPPLRAIS